MAYARGKLQELKDKLGPLEGCEIVSLKRVDRIMKWDARSSPTEFLREIQQREKEESGRRRFRDPRLREVEARFGGMLEKLEDIHWQAAQLVFNQYSKYEGRTRVILICEN